MQGDIFNFSTGTFHKYRSCCNATGDILNAGGDIMNPSSCDSTMPYSDIAIQQLRDRVSVTLNNKALAEAEREQAYKNWKNCKQKVFKICRGQNDTLDAKEAAQDAARIAYTAAVTDLNNALAANAQAKAEYDQCHAAELEYQRQLAEQKAQEAAAEAAAELERQKQLGEQQIAVMQEDNERIKQLGEIAKINPLFSQQLSLQPSSSLQKAGVSASSGSVPATSTSKYLVYGLIAIALVGGIVVYKKLA